MKNIILVLLMTIFAGQVFAQKDQVKFQIDTPYGIIKGYLYNETPQHRDNFIKLANEGWYEDSPFHRIIKDFMIQGGGNKDGRTDPGYTVPAEILPSKFIHKKGALSAARMGDDINPTKASSGSQFYIVQGKKSITDNSLVSMESRINQGTNRSLIMEYITRPENAETYQQINTCQQQRKTAELNVLIDGVMNKIEAEGTKIGDFHYSEKQKAVYATLGGTPHLDGGYTVFGEITEGFDVIDKIAVVPTGGANKPVQAVSMKITILD